MRRYDQSGNGWTASQASAANQPTLVLGSTLANPTPSWTLGFLAQQRSLYFGTTSASAFSASVVWAAYNSATACQPNGLLYTVVGPSDGSGNSLRLNNRAMNGNDLFYGSSTVWQNNQPGFFDVASCARTGWVHAAGLSGGGAQPFGAIGVGNSIDLYSRAFDG